MYSIHIYSLYVFMNISSTVHNKDINFLKKLKKTYLRKDAPNQM